MDIKDVYWEEEMKEESKELRFLCNENDVVDFDYLGNKYFGATIAEIIDTEGYAEIILPENNDCLCFNIPDIQIIKNHTIGGEDTDQQ